MPRKQANNTKNKAEKPKKSENSGKKSAKKKAPTKEMLQLQKILLAKRKILTGDVHQMEEEVLLKERHESASQDISNFADLGSDNFEQEFTIGLMESESEALAEIDAALERIDEGSFGICENCEKRINKPRLKAIPYARLCIDCKREEEKQEPRFR